MQMWKILLIGIIGGLLILVCNTAVSKIMQYCFHYKIQSERNSIQVKAQKVTIDLSKLKFLPFFVIWIIIEEFLFRYLLFVCLNRYCNSLLLSMLISSFVFTLVHTQYKYKMIQVFIMGLILCGTYIMSDNLISPIISHSIYNFAIIYLLKDNEKKS